jgi:hypothetical protein
MPESPHVAWQIDHTILDVIVGDLLLTEDQSGGCTSRPHLFLCIDPMSRLIVGSIISTGETEDQTIPVPMGSTEHAPAESEGIGKEVE